MPSVLHQVIVDLFRHRGELAPVLLRRCAAVDVDYARVELGSIDLSQVASTEYRADAVVLLLDRAGAAVTAVIVEVQLRADPGKRWTWPLYLAALRAERRCPAILLVVTTDAAVAHWARDPIELGHPGFCLAPVVVGFDDVPRIVDLGGARRLPELSVLSALAHPDFEVTATALQAMTALPEDQNRIYWDVIIDRLPDVIRRALEDQMQGYVYQTEFARNYFGQGREEGIEVGREEGRATGLREAVVGLARAKLESFSEADDAATRGLQDCDVLNQLVRMLGQATDARAAREVFDAVVADVRRVA
jgi:hypothetical protein